MEFFFRFLFGFVGVALPLTLNFLVNQKLVATWKNRGINYDITPFWKYLPGAVGTLVFMGTHALFPNLTWEVVNLGLLAAMSVIAARTDYHQRLIPWEIGVGVGWVGVIFTIFGTIFSASIMFSILSFVFSVLGTVGLAFLARALTAKALGFGDIRVMWAVAATVGWWIGPINLMYGLLLASVIQAFVHLFFHFTKRGEVVESEGKKKRLRRAVPYGPALLVGYWSVIAYSLITGNGTCEVWSITGVC